MTYGHKNNPEDYEKTKNVREQGVENGKKISLEYACKVAGLAERDSTQQQTAARNGPYKRMKHQGGEKGSTAIKNRMRSNDKEFINRKKT